MRKSTQEDAFWPSMVDLMTSLFFIMLVLFVVVYLTQRKAIAELKLKQQALEEVEKFKTALGELDRKYFDYDAANSRFRLRVNVQFDVNKAVLDESNPQQKQMIADLIRAGEVLKSFKNRQKNNSQNLTFLFIVEGNAQRLDNWQNAHHEAYMRSYERALYLVNLWKENGLTFDSKDDPFELLIVGSGHFGRSRVSQTVAGDNPENKKFTIQIVPKIRNLKEFTMEARQ